MAPTTRRALLAAGTAGLLGGCLLGSGDPCPLTASVAAGRDWHLPRRGASNAAAAPERATPAPDDLSAVWESTWPGEVVDLVVADGGVFATLGPPGASSEQAPRAPRLRRIDVATGDRDWERTVPGDATSERRVSSPCYADGRVYASTTASAPGGESTARDGVADTPDTTVVAFDAGDGAVDWQSSPQDAVEIATVARGHVLVRTGRGLVALGQREGEHCWRYRPSGGFEDNRSTARVVGRPALVDQVLVAMLVDGHDRYGLVGIDATSGTEAWRQELARSADPPRSPVVNGAIVLAPDHERIVAASALDGEILWRSGVTIGESDRFAGVAATSAGVVATGEQTVGLDATEGTRQWTGGARLAHPTIGGGDVFGVVTDDHTEPSVVVALDRETGEVAGRYEVNEPVHGRVTVAREHLFVRTDRPGDPDAPRRILALS